MFFRPVYPKRPGSSFAQWQFPSPRPPFEYGYADVIGGGQPPAAEFIYGKPNGDFQNAWGLLDPNTLTWATSAKLIYHAWDGEVLLDTVAPAGGYISSFRLISSGALLPDGFTPFANAAIVGATSTNIHLYANAIAPGIYSLGKILPAGLSSSGFESSFTSASYLGLPGFNSGTFNFETQGSAFSLQFVGVPEPSIPALIGLAVSMSILVRHHRA